ncbi:MAG: phenylalanine--tRNA ligase subunit beta [Gammaproteobacteria bacterium]|nr:phenylalanine--tRNA ligase subunit beta [Gammaproteobacteria bacterium]
MKFNEQWLREWVNPDISQQALLEQLTMAGLEVDAVEPVAAELTGIVVGVVTQIDSHPDAERLQVCTVDVGAEPLTIVCGAKNVALEMKVPTALVGAVLPNGTKIKKAKLRGVASFGMLCSAAELGLAESAAGLMVLPSEGKAGQPVADLLRLKDVSIEIGLTPNRGDCLSLLGIAREVSAITGCKINDSSLAVVESQTTETLSVEVMEPKACPRYVGRVLRGINPAAITPLWMTEKLRRCGLRSIHPVVDVTNFVLLELGQPMHAFDINKLSGKVKVRYAEKNESLTLLDGQKIKLDQDTLVIADQQHALALAGVMGGEDSAVDNETDALFLECAFFPPSEMAGVARQYGLHTDSSHRFERGVDAHLAQRAMARATTLLQDIVGGEAGPIIEVTAEDELPKNKKITLRASRIERVLGQAIPAVKVEAILTALGMAVQPVSDVVPVDEWQVQAPSHRFDIETEADLIEEVARLYGYDKINTARPWVRAALGRQSESHIEIDQQRDILVARGYQEAITYSFVDAEYQQHFCPGIDPVKLVNPISKDMSVMRLSLWPGLIKALLVNQNRQQSRIRLFESGAIYEKTPTGSQEHIRLSGVVMGDILPLQWSESAKKADFFDVKSDLETILGLTRRTQEFIFTQGQHPALHPGQTAELKTPQGGHVGWLGLLHPGLKKTLGVTGEPILFELNRDAVAARSLAVFQASSRFPAISRDLALVVDVELPAETVITAIREIAGECLIKLQLFDVYQGEGIDSGRKSLALGLTLQDTVQTLTDKQVDGLIKRILDHLDQKLGAKLRD